MRDPTRLLWMVAKSISRHPRNPRINLSKPTSVMVSAPWSEKSMRVLGLRLPCLATDLCGRHRQVGSVAGAHLLNDNAGVLSSMREISFPVPSLTRRTWRNTTRSVAPGARSRVWAACARALGPGLWKGHGAPSFDHPLPMWLNHHLAAQTKTVPKWLALGSGNMDQTLRFAPPA